MPSDPSTGSGYPLDEGVARLLRKLQVRVRQPPLVQWSRSTTASARRRGSRGNGRARNPGASKVWRLSHSGVFGPSGPLSTGPQQRGREPRCGHVRARLEAAPARLKLAQWVGKYEASSQIGSGTVRLQCAADQSSGLAKPYCRAFASGRTSDSLAAYSSPAPPIPLRTPVPPDRSARWRGTRGESNPACDPVSRERPPPSGHTPSLRSAFQFIYYMVALVHLRRLSALAPEPQVPGLGWGHAVSPVLLPPP